MKRTILLALFTSFTAYAVEVPPLDPSEELAGGVGSTSDFSVQAFSHPASGTRGELRREFNVGNSFFNTVWVSSPSSTTARDGLGPIYNAVSCSSCHFKDGRGRGLPDTDGVVDVSLLFRLRQKLPNGEVIPHPSYGGQFQPFSISGVTGEGSVHVEYERIHVSYDDGTVAELLRPIYRFIQLNFGPLIDTIASPRVAPQMSGLGLVEAIDEKDILAKADPDDRDGDGISGRANRVFSVEHRDMRLGRFGWKAGKPSLLEQNAAAFNGDIGITSALFPTEECTSVQPDCSVHQTQDDITPERLQQVTTYTQLLSVPMRRDFSEPRVLKGREAFHRISCTSCHTPSYVTSANAAHDVLKGQRIHPYSDFLLHDMGEALADDKDVRLNEEEASTHEWRTPPLWTLGLVPTVNGHTRYLHDGRARSLEEAILWHGGEAEKAKNAFLALPKTEREDLILFLKSL